MPLIDQFVSLLNQSLRPCPALFTTRDHIKHGPRPYSCSLSARKYKCYIVDYTEVYEEPVPWVIKIAQCPENKVRLFALVYE